METMRELNMALGEGKITEFLEQHKEYRDYCIHE